MRRRALLREESGWALMETVASAVLLVVVAVAVAASLDAASRASVNNKSRSAASTLAEQDQERMRGMSVTKLANYRPAPRTVTTDDGATYTIASRTDFISDTTGAVQSCTSIDAKPDFLRITSTVTSAVTGNNGIAPVVQRGIVAPPIGSLGQNQGTFTVQVVDRSGAPVAGAAVTATGSSTTYNDVTNELGCAVFAYVPIGTYTGTVTDATRVDQDGRSPASSSVGTVSEGDVTSVTIAYDIPGTITGTFANPPAAATAMRLVQSGWNNPAGGRNTTLAAGASSVTASGLYPFVAKSYTAYAGTCDTANPTLYATAPTYAPPSTILTAGGSATLPIKLLPVTVIVGSGLATTLKLKATGTGCTESLTDSFPLAGATRTYYLPYGTYTACVTSNLLGRSASGTNSGPGWTVTLAKPTSVLTC